MPHDPQLVRDALAVAHQAADAAAAIHRGHAGAILHIDHKSNAKDLVTEVDKLSEIAIRDTIAKAFPTHQVLGEEAGGSSGDARYRWIVDPLDGTVNYAHGVPFYCVSIALTIDDDAAVGVVLDTARGDRYSAVRGGGATLNGAPIRVSATRDVGDAMLGTGFAYGGPTVAQNLEIFTRVVPVARAVRRPGAAALDLSLVAAGRYDGFWELEVNAWDVAAGMLLVQEAGGSVTNATGAPYRWSDKHVLATNGHLHAALAQLLNVGTVLA